MLSGKPLYGTLLEVTGNPSAYGPLTITIFASWIKLFGENYFLLKFPSIIFDCLIIILIFYTIKELTNNENIAKFASLFYSFSYMPILNSGVLGQNDTFFLTFIIMSLYLLIKDRYVLGAVNIGIGICFLLIPVVVIPAALYYVFKKFRLVGVVKFLSSIIITIILILGIFYINSGINTLYPFSKSFYQSYPIVSMLSPLNFIRTLIAFIINGVYFLTTHTVIPKDINPMSASTHPFNLIFNQIANFILIIGYLSLFLYMIIFKIKDNKLELIRNSFILIFGIILFLKYIPNLYYFWITPLLLILILFSEQERFTQFSLKKSEILGIILTFIGLLIYSALYRWRSDIPEFQRIIIALTPFLISYGTYLMLIRSKIKISWAIIMFSCSAFEIMLINPFLVFRPFLIKFIPETKMASGAGTYLSYATHYPFFLLILGILIIGLILFIKDIHSLFKTSLTKL